jgi:hypothetical protein
MSVFNIYTVIYDRLKFDVLTRTSAVHMTNLINVTAPLNATRDYYAD